MISQGRKTKIIKWFQVLYRWLRFLSMCKVNQTSMCFNQLVFRVYTRQRPRCELVSSRYVRQWHAAVLFTSHEEPFNIVWHIKRCQEVFAILQWENSSDPVFHDNPQIFLFEGLCFFLPLKKKMTGLFLNTVWEKSAISHDKEPFHKALIGKKNYLKG